MNMPRKINGTVKNENILLKCTLNKQKIRETDTLMSPVTCFHRILSHNVCKPVMEAHEAACVGCLLFAGYVTGEVMGKGENGTREGADNHYFQGPALQATS